MSYSAIITRVKTRPHPNADRLLLGLAAGHQVVVGKETQDGELGIYFPSDGQLSERMCLENNLLKEQGGYFDANRRVRAQTFRGTKSEGLWLPLSSVAWTGVTLLNLVEGHQHTMLNGEEICCRYETPATKRAKAQNASKGGKLIRGETRFFRKVGETPQLRHVLHTIPSDALIFVTEKLHGTSGRYGRVLDVVQRPWWKRLLGIGPHEEYRYLNGSRNVILEKQPDVPSFYGNDNFRVNAVTGIELHKGETIYFELVGYADYGKPIMPAHQTTKELQARYGKTMHYRYDCEDGECRLFVYRITRQNADGVVTELSWTQMQQRCAELGLETVPAIAFTHGLARELTAEAVQALVDWHLDGVSGLDHTHIREGVVLRIEHATGIRFVKEKSFAFKVMEGIVKDADDYVDLEEAA